MHTDYEGQKKNVGNFSTYYLVTKIWGFSKPLSPLPIRVYLCSSVVELNCYG